MQKVNFKIKIKSYFLTENHQEKSLIFDPQERHIVMVMDNQEDFPDWQCCNETFIKMTSISRNVTLGFFSIWKFCLAMHYRSLFLKGHLQTFWAWFANVIAKNHWGRRRHVQEKCIWRQKSDNLRSSLPCCKHETWKLLIVIFCSSKKKVDKNRFFRETQTVAKLNFMSINWIFKIRFFFQLLLDFTREN